MKPIWRDIMLALFMGMILPGFMLNFAVMYLDTQMPELPQEPVGEQIILQSQGVLALEDYLVGVVLAEMPASFESEALKAQSVAARTYTCKALDTGGKHSGGTLCGDPGCCQGYITEQTYLQRGGTEEDLEKIKTAVESTAGQVLTYEGTLIEATYFSCSGGSTEDAAAVWGTDYPYLQAVDSPGEEGAAHFQDSKVFTPDTFCDALGVVLRGSPEDWFGTVTYTEGGGVAHMTIGGMSYSGRDLRSRLELRSTAFTVRVSGEEIIMQTRGYGHRVGMSQYGADAMAVTGSTYQEILDHYYPGTTLETRNP